MRTSARATATTATATATTKTASQTLVTPVLTTTIVVRVFCVYIPAYIHTHIHTYIHKLYRLYTDRANNPTETGLGRLGYEEDRRASHGKPAQGIPRIVLGELDAEQKFVSSEGWFGEFESVASFEISGFLPETDRLYLLETWLHRMPFSQLCCIAKRFLSMAWLSAGNSADREFARDPSDFMECAEDHISKKGDRPQHGSNDSLDPLAVARALCPIPLTQHSPRRL